jgi:hypothetical protein
MAVCLVQMILLSHPFEKVSVTFCQEYQHLVGNLPRNCDADVVLVYCVKASSQGNYLEKRMLVLVPFAASKVR